MVGLVAEAVIDVQGLVKSLDAARVAVEQLFARWQELDAIAALDRDR